MLELVHTLVPQSELWPAPDRIITKASSTLRASVVYVEPVLLNTGGNLRTGTSL